MSICSEEVQPRITDLIGTVEQVDQEQLQIEVLSVARVLVKFRKIHEDVVIGDTVKQTHSDDRKDGPERVPEQQVGVLEDAAKTVSY